MTRIKDNGQDTTNMSEELSDKRGGKSEASGGSVIPGHGLSYLTMKAGPKSADDNPGRATVSSYCDKLYDLFGENCVGGTTWNLQYEDQSVNLVRQLEVVVKEGGDTESSNANVRTRVSVATSAYGADTTYSGTGGLCHTKFKWTAVGTVSGLAAVVLDYVMGTTAAWVDANAPSYSVAQARVEGTSLVESLHMVEGAHISSMHLWHKIWQNVMRARLSVATVARVGAQCTWQARPDDPVTIPNALSPGYASKNRGINCMRHWAHRIATGDHLLVEITKDQLYLAPYINYLLGAGVGTFGYENFGNQAGAARRPHIARRTPVPFTYSYLITDGEEGGAFTVVGLGLAGLPGVGGALLGGQVVAGWDWETMGAALRVLAGAVPMCDDMEGAWMLAMIDCFAEPYRGVQNGSAIGSQERFTAYSALMSVGCRSIPKGNLSCCMLTRMTTGSTNAIMAREKAGKLFTLADDIYIARLCIEPLIYALQLSLRQCGATVPVVLPEADFGQLHINAVPGPIPGQTDRSGLHLDLCGMGNKDGPSVCMAMLDLMTVKLYKCAVAAPFLMLRIGNDAGAETCPLVGEVNMGECFTSVHPAQLPLGMMGPEAFGIAGVQYKLGEQFEEMEIVQNPNGYYVRGIPGTVVRMSGGRRELVGESGVAMLGHTITLRRASGIDSDQCRIMMSTVDQNGRRETIAGTVIGHARPNCFAFAPMNSFAANAIREPMTRLDLFSDFDWLTSHDLTLMLPRSAIGAKFAKSREGRLRRAAYVWADYLDTVNVGVGASLVVRHLPKRRKIGEVNHGKTGDDATKG